MNVLAVASSIVNSIVDLAALPARLVGVDVDVNVPVTVNVNVNQAPAPVRDAVVGARTSG